MKMKARRRIQRDRDRRDPRARVRDAAPHDEQPDADAIEIAVERSLRGYDE